MSQLKNCPKCGRLYTYVNRFLCPACIEEEEQEFEQIKEYIYSHPGANTIEVAAATDIDEDKIVKFIRQGRLQSEGLAIAAQLTCDVCGVEIESGNLCPDCADKMRREFEEAGRKLQGADQTNNQDVRIKGRIYTADRMNKR